MRDIPIGEVFGVRWACENVSLAGVHPDKTPFLFAPRPKSDCFAFRRPSEGLPSVPSVVRSPVVKNTTPA